jgi:methionyl-tRNA formyltransferase
MTKREWSVLFLGKEKDGRTEKATEFCRGSFANVRVQVGNWGDPLPADAGSAGWDCVISYLSRWIVAGEVLASAKIAINFHPGPPEYPGYGCNNFAIYEGAREYGVTCHHMAPRVDTGAIVEVVRFPILPTDNAGTLLVRAYDAQLELFYRIIGMVARGEALPVSSEIWTRKPFTRAQFGELGRLTPDMTAQEIARRKRALDVGALKPAS